MRPLEIRATLTGSGAWSVELLAGGSVVRCGLAPTVPDLVDTVSGFVAAVETDGHHGASGWARRYEAEGDRARSQGDQRHARALYTLAAEAEAYHALTGHELRPGQSEAPGGGRP